MIDTPQPAESTLGLDLGGAPVSPTPYRVLARKYRPSTFDDLIGQDAMVRTLANSFKAKRIHQAYIFTGVRGVGKTTTARILARALNYLVPGEYEEPSVVMPELGVHCQAIIDSRHVDVIEMDAASHTGIDDIREIVENARYRPVSARMKVYIIDEVHMLSKQAFNGLLKTLEEPPEHVKFLFATTEIEKVPVTVRSRCIRFDLKRIDSALMVKHLTRICGLEGVAAAPDALALIARVAEGSVRDALSLLDQGIAHGEGAGVEVADVRAMLGLSDRGDIIDLFELAMRGKMPEALELTERLHRAGADPAEMLIELAEFCHLVTRLKIAPAALEDPAISELERKRASEMARALAMGPLSRAWQVLLKGVDDVKDSPRPLASAEMALIRLAYAADLPSPEEALRKLAEAPDSPPRAPSGGPAGGSAGGPSGGGSARASPALTAPAAESPAGLPRLERFEDVVALARARRDLPLVRALEYDVRLSRFEFGRIEFSLVEGASPALAQTLSQKLGEWTGARWMIALVKGATQPTIQETAEAKASARLEGVAGHPLVQKVMERFPGARIVDVRGAEAPAPAAETQVDEDVGYADAEPGEDDF
ncbi:MAG: DNA polymerase III subunit gamma/tau [Roseiarcus sp.]